MPRGAGAPSALAVDRTACLPPSPVAMIEVQQVIEVIDGAFDEIEEVDEEGGN